MQAQETPGIPLQRQYAGVLFPTMVDRPFTYALTEATGAAVKGSLVMAPLRSKATLGVLWEEPRSQEPTFPTKDVLEVLPLPPLSETFLSYLAWVATYTMTPLGGVLKMALNVDLTSKKIASYHRQGRDEGGSASISSSLDGKGLSPCQVAAWEKLRDTCQGGVFRSVLLQGVTGSGKTEVYFKAIEEALTRGEQCLILQPEINLTRDWLRRFRDRFGFTPDVWHSNLPPKVRRTTWLDAHGGKSKVVVGARSAVFLPFASLGLIVVDEEHDTSYKQEEQILYNARDMAVVRAKFAKCPILLVSATPSLETLANVKAGRYDHITLTERYGNVALPSIQLMDMRLHGKALQEQGRQVKRTLYLAQPTQDAIGGALAEGNQVLVFLNRRGYAPLTLCRACGHRLECPNCSAWLVEHRRNTIFRCHHCGFSKPHVPACPSCGVEDALVPCGPGVERLAEEVELLFPQARVMVMTSDTLKTPAVAEASLARIMTGEVDIIIGTQVMAKGYTFPNITLTVVVDADIGLGTSDLRASERTFHLLHQVGGRAGRVKTAGSVYIQTFDPDHPLMCALAAYDDAGFYHAELEKRQGAMLPPFARMALVTIAAPSEEAARGACHFIEQHRPPVGSVAASSSGGPGDSVLLKVLGPSPALMPKRKRLYRWRYLLQATKEFNIQGYIQRWLRHYRPSHGVKITVDIDPQSFI